MKGNSDFKDLLCLFNDKKVDYLVVGGQAVILYSEPRYTKDLDVWVKPTQDNAARVYSALADFGAPLEQLSITVEDFSKEGYFVQFGCEPCRIDILMSLKGIRFSDAWERKSVFSLGGISINVIHLDDLIATKNAVGRPQDLLDVSALKEARKLTS